MLLVAGLHVPGALGVVRPRPALGVVPGIPQRVEGLFMPWRGDVQRPPGGQLDASGERVDVRSAVVVTMQYGTAGILVGVEAGERSGLPLLENLSDLVGSRLVLGRPRDDAARIAPLVRTRVRHQGDQVRVAPQHRHLGTSLALVVALLKQITYRATCRALAMAQELDVHSTSLPWSSGA